jgi:hypothetical protein
LKKGIFTASQMQQMAHANYSIPPGLPIPTKAQKDKALELLKNTVWPITFTVAVSEKAYGGSNKNRVCYQPILITNTQTKKNIIAIIVDFCPTNGCLWPSNQLDSNVDIYGQAAWLALGAGLTNGTMPISIQWPAGVVPNSSFQNHYYSIIYFILLWIVL